MPYTTARPLSFAALALVVPLLCSIAQPVAAQTSRAVYAERLRNESDDWFKSDEGRQRMDNIVSWQNANGGWWKDFDTGTPRPATNPIIHATTAPAGDGNSVWLKTSTIDNGATYSELRLLASAFHVTQNPAYLASFNKGLDYLFSAQYPNGGWPQRFPLQDNYGRNITFNDDAMVGVMHILKDTADAAPNFSFATPDQRKRCKEAFDHGVDCILNCQIKLNGHLTAWCQQHDSVTLAPAGARAYELPSITGSESSGIMLLLMEIDHPSQRIIDSINAAYDWYESVKITGKAVKTVRGPQYENGVDRIVVDDPSALPMWARFYDLQTGKPFFCSRDGVKKDSIADISHERRNGYAWYGNWGSKVEKAYPQWKAKVANSAATAPAQ